MTQEPESGQTSYSYVYNAIGLQVTRTRPSANVNPPSPTTTTTYQYDALGRILSVIYSDGTTPRYFDYDTGPTWGGTPTNQKGRLAWYGNAPSGGTVQGIFGYDAMGRESWTQQCDPSNCGTGSYGALYTYDWLGNLLTEDTGQGDTSTNTYYLANEITGITVSENDSCHPPTFVANVINGPYGRLSWQLGNGLSAAQNYDAMGRIAGGWVCQGASQPTQPGCTGGTTLYSFTSGWKGSYLTSAADTALNQSNSYDYDDFGRLASMTVNSGTPGSFTYTYDRWVIAGGRT